MDPLYLASASELARMIRHKEISSQEAVSSHIRRIQEVNPQLNAVVAQRFETAMDEARAVDEVIAQAGDGDSLPPFLGVPCTIKEAFALVGMPNTAGLVARRDLAVTEDATTVARLRQAGAIPLGVTNTSELCMWIESNNRLYGRTQNPYDTSRTVGGSSGGEGAIVGAGASPFGLGADVGGSIRLPAFFNGVFGHKPTGGTVPATGQFPVSENAALRYLCSGPLCRRAEDLMPLLRILAGPDGHDAGCVARTLGDEGEIRPEDLTILQPSRYRGMSASREMVDTVERAAERLEALGATRRSVQLDGFRYALEMWSALMEEARDTSFGMLMAQGQEFPLFRESLRWFTGRSPHTFPALGLVALERVGSKLEGLNKKMMARFENLSAEMSAMMEPNTVLLYPPYATVAPRHRKALFPPTKWRFTAIFNILEFPVTQVPMGLNGRGLPLGLQVVAGHGRDHVSIAVGRMLEREFGGWVPPAITDK